MIERLIYNVIAISMQPGEATDPGKPGEANLTQNTWKKLLRRHHLRFTAVFGLAMTSPNLYFLLSITKI